MNPVAKQHPYHQNAERAMRKAARAMRHISRARKPIEAVLQATTRAGKRQIEESIRHSAVGEAAHEVRHPLETVFHSMRRTPVGQALWEFREMRERSLAGEALALLADTPEGRAIGGAFGDIARYTRKGMLSTILQQLGPVGQVIDFVRGLRRDTGVATDRQIEAAINLLTAHGYQVLPPGTQAAGGVPPRQPPPGHGSFDVGGQAPESGGGMHGRGSFGSASIGTAPRLPVGTFPGGLYVPMELVSGSSNVYAIGYSEDTLTMRVEYLAPTINADALRGRGHSGRGRVRGTLHKTVLRARHGPGPLYDYHGVPRHVFINIRMAGSKGRAIWDELRVRGTMYGHQYDYELVAASKSLVLSPVQHGPAQRVGTITYVPRKAIGPQSFKMRTIRQGNQMFRSILPSVGLSRKA